MRRLHEVDSGRDLANCSVCVTARYRGTWRNLRRDDGRELLDASGELLSELERHRHVLLRRLGFCRESPHVRWLRRVVNLPIERQELPRSFELQRLEHRHPLQQAADEWESER